MKAARDNTIGTCSFHIQWRPEDNGAVSKSQNYPLTTLSFRYEVKVLTCLEEEEQRGFSSSGLRKVLRLEGMTPDSNWDPRKEQEPLGMVNIKIWGLFFLLKKNYWLFNVKIIILNYVCYRIDLKYLTAAQRTVG